MIETMRRICELQPHYTSKNTPEMQERGVLIRKVLTGKIQDISAEIASALGPFGNDLMVEGRDGTGQKTELPWVRFCSETLSPSVYRQANWHILESVVKARFSDV